MQSRSVVQGSAPRQKEAFLVAKLGTDLFSIRSGSPYQASSQSLSQGKKLEEKRDSFLSNLGSGYLIDRAQVLKVRGKQRGCSQINNQIDQGYATGTVN